jgi:hypothetical protein
MNLPFTGVADNSQYQVDTTAPIATATFFEVFDYNSFSVTVGSSEPGVGYLVDDRMGVMSQTNLANAKSMYEVEEIILPQVGAVTISPLSVGSFHFYTFDAAGNMSAPVFAGIHSDSEVSYSPASSGIAGIPCYCPIVANGKLFYIMDTNGDGKITTADKVLNSFFDGKLTNSLDGNETSITGTDITLRFRYGEGGHTYAVPTVGVSGVTSGNVQGTSYSDINSYGVISTDKLTQPANYSYTDFAAIWDANNGTASGAQNIAGVPTGPDWVADRQWASSGLYWAADKVGNDSHLAFSLETGTISTILDNSGTTAYVVLQVV